MYPIRTGKEFLERGYKVYGLCTSDTQVANGMRSAGIETFEISSKAQLVTPQLLKLDQWLKKRNVKIVHCHKSGDILASALLSLFNRRKTFFTEHMGVTRPKKDLYHKWAYSHVNQVFSISDETFKRNLNALPVPANRITRLWLGTDISEQPIDNQNQIAPIKSELGLPSDSIVIGNLGRVCLGKGQMQLLEAFNLLSDKYSRLHLLLVGGLDASEGSDNKFVNELKERIDNLGLTQRVHLAGFRTDTSRMLAAMDIVCLPNHNEAFGLTAIEAMAAKKPIVAANTGALPEILESTALLTNPFAPLKIAASIESYLLNKNLMRKNSILAYQRAKSEFSMSAHIERLATHYHK
ncbi:Glycosyltransferase [Vibrio neptunius]